MIIVIDIECNALENPDKIWLIVCKDIDTGEYHVFKEVSDNLTVGQAFREFIRRARRVVGHNLIGYDWPILCNLIGDLPDIDLFDTLVVSKLIDYSRKGGHSIEQYGEEFGIPKGNFSDFSCYSEEMEKYCVRDVDICYQIYLQYVNVVDSDGWFPSFSTEQSFQFVVNDLHNNGFGFDSRSANRLLSRVNAELAKLDEVIYASFRPRLKFIREVHPCLTRHGTLNKKDFRFIKNGDLTGYGPYPFSLCKWESFNPASHKQIVDVLYAAGWRPTDRTAGAIQTARELNNSLDKPPENKYGWKINETNLATLPADAPVAAKSLARRILVESRRRTLTEWLSLVAPDQRIHGKFYAIGAWTHRMAHQAPNTANIPNSEDTQGKTRLYGAEMRSLWCAPPRRLLVGVDAEGIQLRIFAHYIDDPEFTEALVNGRKEDKSDPHSLNQRVLGSVCRSRAAAKRFIYALLLGAGIRKLSEILETDADSTTQALDRLVQRYQGFAKLKKSLIPIDAARGYFVGLDGRKVKIYGSSENERRHLAMSGYLQNGEAVVMKHATLRWYKILRERGIDFKLVNMVHDEWQTECEDYNTAVIIAQEQCDSLRWVGEQFGLKCPLAGSYMTDGKYTIGDNWKITH